MCGFDGSRAPLQSARARVFDQALKERLLAVVLTCVLIWYTVVVTPRPASPRVKVTPEERGAGRPEVDEASGPRSGQTTAAADSPPLFSETISLPAEELEWPEVIEY